MPSVAIMFNVLPINCEEGFEMIYRIQGDKAVSWPRTWERLERKWVYCGSRSSRCCYLQKDGKKPLIFLLAQLWLGMDRERDGDRAGWGMLRGCFWVFALCLSLCRDERGSRWKQRGFGTVVPPHKPIRFSESEPSPLWVRDADNSRPLGGGGVLKSGQTLGKYSVIA